MRFLIYLALIPAVVWAALHCSWCSLFDIPSSNRYAHRSLPEVFRSLAVEQDRRQELDARSTALMRCLMGKDRIAQDVLAGRLELLEAAAGFRDLQNAVPRYDWRQFRALYAGASDEEKLCRTVIDYVSIFAEEASPGGKTVLDRLEAELKLHLESGTLRLRPARPLEPLSRSAKPRTLQ